MAAPATFRSAMSPLPPVRLHPHPTTPCAALDAIAVEVDAGRHGLRLTYRLAGRVGGLRVVAAGVPARRDGLWRTTCCEAFVGVPGDPAYREFNFAPAGDWAAYDFSAERARAADPELAAPVIELHRSPDALTLCACLPRAALPAASRLELGLSVVVETADGALSCWALRHPAPAPDFHRRDAFALFLDLAA